MLENTSLYYPFSSHLTLHQGKIHEHEWLAALPLNGANVAGQARSGSCAGQAALVYRRAEAAVVLGWAADRDHAGEGRAAVVAQRAEL